MEKPQSQPALGAQWVEVMKVTGPLLLTPFFLYNFVLLSFPFLSSQNTEVETNKQKS